MINETIIPLGGLNLDDDLRFIKNTDSRYRLNVIYENDGDGGLLRPVLGNSKIAYTLPTGDNKVVGSCEDKEDGKMIYFVYNSKDDDCILEYDGTSINGVLVEKDLGLTADTFVDCAVMDGKLFWAIEGMSPKKINIARAKTMTEYEAYVVAYYDGTVDVDLQLSDDYVYVAGKGLYEYKPGKGDVGEDVTWWDKWSPKLTFVTSDLYWDIEGDPTQIEEIKPPPLGTVEVTPIISTEGLRDVLSEKSLKFSYRYIYKDDERSVFAKPSYTITNPYKAGEGVSFNVVNVRLERGNNDVDRIEVVTCDAITNQWYKVGEVELEDFNGEERYVYEYNGLARYEAIADVDISEPFHSVPLKTPTVAVNDNRIFHGDVTEGFNLGEYNIAITPVEQTGELLDVDINVVHYEDFSGVTKYFTTDEIKIAGVHDAVVPKGVSAKITFGRYTQNRGTAGLVVADGVKTYADFTEEIAASIRGIPLIYTGLYGATAADTDYYAETDYDANFCYIDVFKGIRQELINIGYPTTAPNIMPILKGAFDGTVIKNQYEYDEVDLWDSLVEPDPPTYQYTRVLFEDITIGQTDPEVLVTDVIGGTLTDPDAFKDIEAEIERLNYWQILDYGGTGLVLDSVEYTKPGDVIPKLKFTGTASEGIITLRVTRYRQNVLLPWRYILEKGSISAPDTELCYIYVTESGESVDIPNEKYSRTFYYDIEEVSDNVGVFRTYKQGASYEGGLVFYDDALRKSLVTSRTAFSVPYRAERDTKTYLEVAVTGSVPSWAKYFSFAHTKASISDGVMVDLFGGGEITLDSVLADSTDYILDVYIAGVPSSVDTIYGRSESGGSIMLYSDSGYTNLIARNRGVAARLYIYQNEQVYFFNIKGEKDYEGITGFVHADMQKKSGAAFSFDTAKNSSTEESNYVEYKLNIAQYVNTLKKNLEPEQNVFLPQTGDSVRVIEYSGVPSWDNEFMVVSKVDEGQVITNDNEEGYFAYYIIYCRKPLPNTFDFSDGGVIEIFRRKDTGESLFYEEPVLRNVSTLPSFIVDNGDAYTRPRVYSNTKGDTITDPVYVEDFRVTDTFNSKVWSEGRVNAYGKNEQKRLKSGVRWGGRLLEETKINNTCAFHGSDIRFMDDDNGAIARVVSLPNRLRVLQERRASTVDIGRMLVTRPDGQEEMVASDRIWGSVRQARNRWGCSNPESVIEVNGTVYYMDTISGQFISDGDNGQFPISGKVVQGEYANDYKMHSYFDVLTGNVYTGYDDRYKMLYVTGEYNSLVTTVGYHIPTNRWLSFYSFTPENYSMIGNRMFSFKDGELWQHNVGTRANFYGTQYVTKVYLTSTESPLQSKVYDAVWLRVNGLTIASLNADFMEIVIPADDTYDERYSIITSGMLKRNEGEWRAPVLRNMKTNSSTSSNIDLYNGAPMRGNVAEIKLNFGTSDFRLMGANVVMTEK